MTGAVSAPCLSSCTPCQVSCSAGPMQHPFFLILLSQNCQCVSVKGFFSPWTKHNVSVTTRTPYLSRYAMDLLLLSLLLPLKKYR